MQDYLNSLLQRVANGTLLPPAYFAGLDCNAALDARDGNVEFDRKWSQLAQVVDHRWTTSEPASDIRALVEEIRRESFLTVSRSTNQHEIAGYVSDDFDLIVRARLVGVADEFLERLWEKYNNGEFPYLPN